MENTTISMFEIQLKHFIEALRPADKEIRKMLDFGFSWDGKSAYIFEIRPQWNDPGKLMEHNVAKLQYTKSRNIWKLYWLRASGKWEAYAPHPTDTDLQSLLAEIKNDEHNYFFG